jgi:MoxR-like ATPase
MIVTLHLPENLRELVEKVAAASKVSEEDVLLDWLNRPLPYPNKDSYETILASVDTFSNVQLWTLVYRTIPDEDEARYHFLKEKGDLSDDEKAELESIVELTNINILLRAKALVVLKERGEDINIFLERDLIAPAAKGAG